jgi:putative endonuclease
MGVLVGLRPARDGVASSAVNSDYENLHPVWFMDPDFRQEDGESMSKEPSVYILASRRNGTIYIGVTSDLMARLHQHRTGATRGFASDHKVYRLVHFEMFGDIYSAISREKQLKAWRRAWKVALIEEGNPFWEDRAVELGFDPVPAHPASIAKPSERGS